MKPYGREEDLSYTPDDKDSNSKHLHRWQREERRAIKRGERKKARQQAKKEIMDSILKKDENRNE